MMHELVRKKTQADSLGSQGEHAVLIDKEEGRKERHNCPQEKATDFKTKGS